MEIQGGLYLVNFRNAGNRCAVILSELNLPVNNQIALAILKNSGFHLVHTSNEVMINMMRHYIGSSDYKRGASPNEAPKTMDCSSLIKHAYSTRGVWLPRLSLQQRDYCPIVVNEDDIQAGDILFTTGLRNYFEVNPNDGVGHVGLATGEGTVIHAANSVRNVVEDPMDIFLKDLRGIRRITPKDQDILTIESSSDRIAEESNYFRWVILQQCKS